MTREEREKEAHKQGVKEVKNTYPFIHNEEFSCEDMVDMFLKGVKWADEHPRKGLFDIEKAYDWIELHASEYIGRSDYMSGDFRKAMLKGEK